MANLRVVEVIENRLHLSQHLLTNVLQKLKDKQFDKIAIVSVIGPHFEGNTFTANLILNYLQRQNNGHTYPDQWPRDVILRYNCGFKSVDNYPDDCGQQMCPGVEMWSEPFIVRDGSTRVAVLLMNVQNFAYTLADLIRGDTLLIDMFRLISSVSTIVVINKPGLKQHPLGSGYSYMMRVNWYDHFLTTLNQWENSDYGTLMVNGSQISDRSEQYQKLNEEFNKNSTYLVSCPTNAVINNDWKLRELCPQYVDEIEIFIPNYALNVNNPSNGITFTNTDQLMKVIMGKVQELNHNNSVNTGPTHEPYAVPDKHTAPTRSQHQSSAVTAKKITFTDGRQKPNVVSSMITSVGNIISKPFTKQPVTENELGAFVTPLIQKYTKLISQLSNTCDPDTQVYARKSRDVRNQALNKFDTEFGRKEPISLVTEQRLTLIARLDDTDMTIAKEMMAKSAQNLQELVESCVKEFNDKMIAAIDRDIEMNGVDNDYNKIYTNVNNAIIKLFNKRAMSIITRKSQRKAYLSRLTDNIPNCVEKYKYLYDCNERYRDMCGQHIVDNRYLPDRRLLDMQREVEVTNTLLSNTQLMERLLKIYDKSYRYFTTVLKEIRICEPVLADRSIELTVVRYRELFHRVLMSKFYIPSDLNAIHNQLMSECLALLKRSCAFTTAQSSLEDTCLHKCEGQLCDAFTHIKVDYTAKLRRLLALNKNIVNEMEDQYCLNVSKQFCNHYIAVDHLKRLLESESNHIIMNTFAARMDPIGREWDRYLVIDIEQKHRERIKPVLSEQMREYELNNYLMAPIGPTLGVYFGRSLLVGGYIDGRVRFVPNGDDSADNTHSKHYVDNCIAFSDQILYGREAKDYLTANSLDTEFDVKDLLGRDRVDGDELKRYPFDCFSNSPPKFRPPLHVLKAEDNGINAETLVALQVLDIKHRAETAMKTPAQRAVFCVPTRYNTKQRRAMLDVGLIAGFDRNNVHIIDEMTAAVIAYFIGGRRKPFVGEIVLIFAIHGNYCECGLIKLGNDFIEHMWYDVIDDLSIFDHGHRLTDKITSIMFSNKLTMDNLTRVIVIGYSDRITGFQDLIKSTLTPEITGKNAMLYDCDAIDEMVKGTVYYPQLKDTINVRQRADNNGLNDDCITDQRNILHKLGVLGSSTLPNTTVPNRSPLDTGSHSLRSAPLTTVSSVVTSVSNAMPAPTAPAIADPVQEFSQLCADIKARLETCGAIATNKSEITKRLDDFEKIVTTNAKEVEQQKRELKRVINLLNLKDKLIVSSFAINVFNKISN